MKNKGEFGVFVRINKKNTVSFVVTDKVNYIRSGFFDQYILKTMPRYSRDDFQVKLVS